jgi:hypothetical protein
VKNVCGKYILGAAQGISLTAGRLDDKKTFCIPDNVGEPELVDIFVNTARIDFAAYPQDRNLPAVLMLATAIMQAFPCQDTNRNTVGKDA